MKAVYSSYGCAWKEILAASPEVLILFLRASNRKVFHKKEKLKN